jgi:hypothetical protein
MVQISPRSDGSDHVATSCFATLEVRAPPSFDPLVSEMLISRHVSFLDRQSRSFCDFVFHGVGGWLSLILFAVIQDPTVVGPRRSDPNV